MTSLHKDNELQHLMLNLKNVLKNFPQGTGSLEIQLESAAKHVPAYLKIVKGHIEQLATVLQMESHNCRTLDNAGLAEPVKQLIEIFKILKEEDLSVLESLAIEASNWEEEIIEIDIKEPSLAING
ncbi:MAG: hypothetical protein JWM09_637 [Francisellaceae bacterium]|nr:hypothetical protein [Francisellaceae bacterium]